jgi:predicted 2-oxoglutarate/Fe(II)-dependent dioxygenase YbiX/peroxiredoxin
MGSGEGACNGSAAHGLFSRPAIAAILCGMADMLLPGDSAPWFHAAALDGNPRYAFDTVAGRWIVLLFHGSGAWEACSRALEVAGRHRDLFDDVRACFFSVTIDAGDVSQRRIRQQLPGIRHFLDYDQSVSRRYGAVQGAGDEMRYQPHWLLLDPTLRVVERAAIGDGDALIATARAMIAAGEELPNAPVLTVPRIFDPELCRRLVSLYEEHGGEESGFMREENGITVGKIDHTHKRRADYTIEDADLRGHLRERLRRFLAPQIERAFQFQVTRLERWIVACYDGDNGGGHFRAHRDNTTKGTAHRKFACTINLNAGEYDGGELRFPEYGQRTYRAPTGGAIVFSCSMLHEATPVTRGKRYAFLPFLYDEAGAELREKNLAFVSPELATYRSGIVKPVEVTASE